MHKTVSLHKIHFNHLLINPKLQLLDPRFQECKNKHKIKLIINSLKLNKNNNFLAAKTINLPRTNKIQALLILYSEINNNNLGKTRIYHSLSNRWVNLKDWIQEEETFLEVDKTCLEVHKSKIKLLIKIHLLLEVKLHKHFQNLFNLEQILRIQTRKEDF